ncbi:hypothetical protein OZX61_12680 (plasmid) [Acinetobacter sp. ESL0695]|uniref:hypothetical protein n=1 Tax=Acinetobacter sp. ESL0695 TaxID=2983215 RepID=UPI0023F24B93|nr:hypothetical protein [Acinetobacter sp. ESL0695]WEV50248.1 hypothetical protein OZX61_12680 [Acinetobacter sp. ESL0695]
MNNIVKIAITIFASIVFIKPTTAVASDFGCQALLCFAGGKGVAECQSTIRKVLRDLAKGKGFPICTFDGPRKTIQSSENLVSTRLYRKPWGTRNVCPDGQTMPKRWSHYSLKNYYCPTIEIKLDPSIVADKSYLIQEYNYDDNW